MIQLKRLKSKSIPVYVIPGSHDYSPSGKTMIEVLEKADLLINVFKGEVRNNELHLEFTIDEKTGVKLCGMPGKKGVLETKLYTKLARTELEEEPGQKIFLFHSTINELKTENYKQVEGESISMLPKNFNYYAGGHIHVANDISLEGYEKVVYPGPTFPVNFAELEKLGVGGYYLVEDSIVKFEPIVLKKQESISLDVQGKNIFDIHEAILSRSSQDLSDTILTIRLKGQMQSSTLSDLNLKSLRTTLENKGAYVVLISTAGITTIKNAIQQNQINLSMQQQELMNSLDISKKEGETVNSYEKRVIDGVSLFLESQ